MRLDLLLKEVGDRILRENFTRLSDFLAKQQLLDGDWYFFEVNATTSGTISVPHRLSYVPRDIILLHATGDQNYYFNYQDFDRENIYITVQGPVLLRFFAGRVENKAYGGMRPEHPFVQLSTGGGGGGSGTTWLTGNTNPSSGLGANGDFYLNLVSKSVFYKTGGVWVDQGYLGDQPPTKVQVTYQAAQVISALRPVYADTLTTVRVADLTAFNTSKVLGIATNAASIGASITVLTFGLLVDAALNYPINDVLFLSSSGTITNVAPTSGHLVRIGHSLGNGRIFVKVEEPIIL